MDTGKYNIYYYIGEEIENVELYCYSDKIALTEIKVGYKETRNDLK